MANTPGVVAFPGAPDDQVSLLEQRNRAHSVLDSAIVGTPATLSLGAATAGLFPTGAFALTIEDEIILIASRAGQVCDIAERGADGTTPADHDAGVAVSMRVISLHRDLLKDTLFALEAKIGTGADTPTAGDFFKATGAGTSGWAPLAGAEVIAALGYTPMPASVSTTDIPEGTNLYFTNARVASYLGGLSGTDDASTFLRGDLTWANALVAATGGAAAFQVMVTGDTVPRLQVNGQGQMYFSPGSVDFDTYLYRAGAGLLYSDGSLGLGGGLNVNSSGAAAGNINASGASFRFGPNGSGATSLQYDFLGNDGAGASVLVRMLRGGTVRGQFGVAGGAGALIADDVTNDVAFRTAGGRIGFSTDAGATASLILAGSAGLVTVAPDFRVTGHMALGLGSPAAESGLYVNSSLTSTFIGGFGVNVLPQIAADANGRSLYGVRSSPSWVAGGFTGLSAYGLYGNAGASGFATAYGVYGAASGATTNWAGYFGSGDVRVTNQIYLSNAKAVMVLNAAGTVNRSIIQRYSDNNTYIDGQGVVFRTNDEASLQTSMVINPSGWMNAIYGLEVGTGTARATSANKLSVGWPGSGVGMFYMGDYSNGFVWTETSDVHLHLHLSQSGAVNAEILDLSTTGVNFVGTAYIGLYGGSNTYAQFSYAGMGTTQYALLQDNSGATYLNAASGQPLSIRNGNAEFVQIGNYGMVLGGSAQTIYFANTAGTGGYITRSISTGDLIVNSQAGLRLYAPAGQDIRLGAYTYPNASASYDLGAPTLRWNTIYSVNALNTSLRSAKTDIEPLSPERALALVKATPMYTYRYREGNAESVRWRHAGFMADEVDRLLSPDGESASPSSTAALALAAIQELERRLSILEGRAA